MKKLRRDLPDLHRLIDLIMTLCLLIMAALPGWSFAQTEPDISNEIVKVGLYESPPFVMDGAEDNPQGMAIDLWENLAERLGVTSEYAVYPTLSEMRRAIQSGEIDAAVTNLTVTQERAKFADFTQPWFDGGMRIMISDSSGTGLGAVVAGLASAGYLRAYGWLALVIVLGFV